MLREKRAIMQISITIISIVLLILPYFFAIVALGAFLTILFRYGQYQAANL